MMPVVDYPLNEVIYLPEHEDVPEAPDEAINYLAKWDCGEYARDPIFLSDLYALHGRIFVTDQYVLFRSYCGDHTLYRRCG